jgi:hypothetical protein
MTSFEQLLIQHAAQEIEKLQAIVASLPFSLDKCAAIGSSSYILSQLRVLESKHEHAL